MRVEKNAALKKLMDKMQPNEGYLISNPKNCFYFSGVSSSNIALYITKEKRYLLTDFRYFEAANKNNGDFSVLWQKSIKANLREIINEEKVFIETDFLTFDEVSEYEKLFGKKFQKIGNLINEIRLYKNDYEIECIYKAQEIADKAFIKTMENIKEGISERELKAELEYHMMRYNSQKPSFDSIVLFNENTSRPHGESGDKKLCNNSVILIDFGATYEGYCSDTTRTFFFGQVSSEMKTAYNAVLKAHLLAQENIKAGISGKQADAYARDYLYSIGYEGKFGHSLGHGCGIDIHEAPTLSPNAENVILKDSMTYSIEPGIYLPNQFGIRIEDLYFMKNSKSVSFTKLDKKLLEL